MTGKPLGAQRQTRCSGQLVGAPPKTSGHGLRIPKELTGHPADGAAMGEIVYRGNVIMKGYFKDPEATEAVMGDGWFHIGDAAVTHPDGFVEIRDRIKDVIISGSSVEVEGVLLCHPAVPEVAIVGVPHPKWGEAPFAFIVLKPGAEAAPRRLDRLRSRVPSALHGTARSGVHY